MTPRMPMYGQAPPAMPGKKKKKPMMADGDLSAPSEIDSPSPGAAPPDLDAADDSGPVTLETIDDKLNKIMEFIGIPPEQGGDGDPSASPEGMNPEMMPS